MSILNHFLDLLYPKLCVCCENRLISEEEFICLHCLYSLPRTNHLDAENNKLEKFFDGRLPFYRIASLGYFVKGGSIQKIVHEIKYRNNPTLGIFIGKMCGEVILESDYLKDIDFIVPIPLHKKRLKKRGYNQSLMIAEGVASILSKPINSENLIRIINNPSQTKNSKFSRWKNAEGIFGIKEKNIFNNKHILLIDDIVTTGSTLEACSKLIQECANTKISIYVFGCSPTI